VTPRRVAILKPSALGDIVHALPVLSSLRAAWPDAHISWVVNAGFAGLLTGHPDLSEVIPFDRGAFRGNPLRAAGYAATFLGQLRRRRFDLMVDLQGLLRTGLMCAGAGCPRRVGFAAAREGARHFYTERVVVPDADTIHAVDRYRRVLDHLGVPSSPVEFKLPVADSELAAAGGLLRDLPRPWVAVAAGAKWLTKRWPVESFAVLLNRAHAEFGGTAVLLGAPEDNSLHAGLAAKLAGPTLDLTGRTSLPRLAAVLKLADAMLANDTGPLHLAAALGTPCVAPYTCTLVARHGPYGQQGNAVETRVSCGGSYLRQCPNGLVCFAELAPNRLWPPLAAALSPARLVQLGA
jgi:heptosyltransferase-1